MAVPDRIIIPSTQQRWKDSYATAVTLQLTLRANGEEQTSVIDGSGNVSRAGFDVPTVKPTVADAGAGNLTNAKWVCYAYVYAATSRYPAVENIVTGGGSVSPRSNPSPQSDAYQITGVGSRQLNVTCTKTLRTDIDQIWVYRTSFASSAAEASLAATAGLLFYVGLVANVQNGIPGTVVFTDNSLGISEQIENDNFAAPVAQFVVYYDPYFYLFGNYQFSCNIAIDASGLITQSDGASPDWFSGRNGQTVKMDGISSGGADGFGTFYFKYLTATTAQLTVDPEGTVNATVAYTGTTVVYIQGLSTTLWRSKPRNPFSWGFTQVVGSSQLPQLYAFRVSGGLGSAMSVIPDGALLKLDTEYPNYSYALNLKLAGQDAFETSLRVISRRFSVSSNFTQFPALQQNGQQVLWGFDAKNFAILQSDGNFQTPISDPVFKTLREIEVSDNSPLRAHGIFCPRRELNCIWIRTVNAPSSRTALGCDIAILQHAPSGVWSLLQENDVTASAIIEDTIEKESLIFVGTDSGMLGLAFVDGLYTNWLPPFILTDARIISITPGGDGLIIVLNVEDDIRSYPQFAYVLFVTLDGNRETWRQITSYIDFQTFSIEFNDVVGSFDIYDQGTVYFGLVNTRLRRYYNSQAPTTNKRIEEIWLTAENANPEKFFARFYSEYDTTTANGTLAILQDNKLNGSPSNTWLVQQGYPSELTKSFGVEIVERGTAQLKLYDLTIKETG